MLEWRIQSASPRVPVVLAPLTPKRPSEPSAAFSRRAYSSSVTQMRVPYSLGRWNRILPSASRSIE